MNHDDNLQRFLDAQEDSYANAVTEIRAGKKQRHWMWWIFPQILGLGVSNISKFYAIKDLDEAQAYLAHPVLGARLLEITKELLRLKSTNAADIFGSPDNLKLRSCMTLFAATPGSDPLFQSVLDIFFGGNPDTRTISILQK